MRALPDTACLQLVVFIWESYSQSSLGLFCLLHKKDHHCKKKSSEKDVCLLPDPEWKMPRRGKKEVLVKHMSML